MITVYVICEGQTEETFVKEILNSHLNRFGVYLIPSLIGKRGGTIRTKELLTDIRNRLKTSTAYCTTFYDFYGLPKDFPGKSEASKKVMIGDKAQAIYDGIKSELKLDHSQADRFIPYVQMHEFEALLFSHPDKFALGIGQEKLTSNFQQIRQKFDTPEHINDSEQTAPSKRIISCYDAYQKEYQGNLGALEIGLPIIRQECQLFNAWLTRLENLEPL